MKQKPIILLVEDEVIVSMVVSKLLENLGCLVDMAITGGEALAKASKHYDLILMDIGLPDMSGLAVAAEMRRREQGKSARRPIIGFTAYTDPHLRSSCLEVGMNAVLNKPAGLESLKEIITRYIQDEQSI